MKKKVGFFILLLVLGVAGVFIFKSAQRIKEKQNAKENYQEMPMLSFYFLNKNKIRKNIPTVINYFSPDCEHCQYMAKQLKAERYKLDSINYIMITTSSETSARKFINEYQLATLNFLSVGIDTMEYFNKTFQSEIAPSFYIYNSKNALVKTIQGETIIDNLLQPLKMNNN